MRYFTSDLHFSHFNVIKYCNRPYKDVHEMNKALTDMWNNTIGKDDIVYFLGDFSMNYNKARVIARMLNGRKIMIPGNHDKLFKFKPKINEQHCIDATEKRDKKFLEEAKYDGWEAVHQTFKLDLKDSTTVLLSHLPYAPPKDSGLDLRYLEYRPIDEGLVLLHGHIHGRYKKRNKQIDVGIDAHGKILSEDDIIELINDKREFIESPLTEFYKNRG